MIQVSSTSVNKQIGYYKQEIMCKKLISIFLILGCILFSMVSCITNTPETDQASTIKYQEHIDTCGLAPY